MLLSVKELAERLGFSASQIRRLICQNKIKAQKVGNYYAIDERHIGNLKRSRRLNKSQNESKSD